MAEPVSIILLSRDRWPKLRRCLDLLRRRTPADAYELLAFDNASSDGTLEGLRRLERRWPQLRVFHNDGNVPFAAAVNRGMRAARAGRFLWLNDDVSVTPGWLEGLLAAVESGRGVAAAGPMTDRMAPRAQISGPSAGRTSAAYEETQFLGGFCFLIKREAAESAGPLDERFVWGWEDMDYCLRLRQTGARLVLAKRVFVGHEGSQTIRTLPPAIRERDDRRNRELIARKWERQERRRGELLRLFDETPAPWHPLRPRASVLLTCGDARRAPTRLEALRRSEAGASFEVLCGTDSARLRALARGWAGLRLVSSPRSSFARRLNGLAARADGDFIVALDERSRLEKGWLAALLERLPPGGVGLARGGLPFVAPKGAFERVGRLDERFAGPLAAVDFGARMRQERLPLLPLGDLLSVESDPVPETGDTALLLAKWSGSRVFESELRRIVPPTVATIVLRERERRPWARRLNAAIEGSGADHFLVVSEGVRLPGDCARRLIRAAAVESNIGVVAPRSRGTGLSWQDEPGPGPIQWGRHVRSFCFLLPRRMHERIGVFDERFAGSLALTDYCLRSHQLGFQVVVAKDAFVAAPRRRPDPRRAKDFPLLYSKWSGSRLFEEELGA